MKRIGGPGGSIASPASPVEPDRHGWTKVRLVALASKSGRSAVGPFPATSEKRQLPSFAGISRGTPQRKFVPRQPKVGFRLEVEIRGAARHVIGCID